MSVTQDEGEVATADELNLPVLPLRDSVLFPHATLPLNVARARSSRVLETLPADESARVVAVGTQRDPEVQDPDLHDLHGIGTVARIVKVTRVPDEQDTYLVFAAGMQRLRFVRQTQREPFLRARVQLLPEPPAPVLGPDDLALREGLRAAFASLVRSSPLIPGELVPLIAGIDDASLLTDVIAAAAPMLSTAVRLELLGTVDVRRRMRRLDEELVREKEKLDLQNRIQEEIRSKVVGTQREYLLREQLKAIQKELGESADDGSGVEEMARRIDEAALPAEAKRQAERELRRLRGISPASPEFMVAHTYLDWLAGMPWGKQVAREVDLAAAQGVLDEDHYDLEKVKARILEYLAVVKLKGALRGPILCFVGPPGVGKTSLGRSIARALGRPFARISLGGTHDEAEIRGHRRTYVGALPGQIVQGLRRAGTSDPVFMLDEVDKIGRDFRGDPAAALLEVLDPEQNAAFRDHYLEVPFDLSRVLFITTANVLDPIPPALLDRLEVLELPGYSEEEKLPIARRYLVPRQAQESGLGGADELRFSDEALREIALHYTREAGVRSLEREIGSICRKRARQVAAGQAGPYDVTTERVRELLGAPRFRLEAELAERTRAPGVAVALAWTPHGGDVLFVEATRAPRDRGELTLTGQLGQVMQESARAALSWLRANAVHYGIDPDTFRIHEVHIHVPSGAVPKDGPSAGVVMAIALTSAFLDRPVRPGVAMTGEITLSGHVLPVGGIREKVLAARRAGVRDVILPAMNEPHVLEEIPETLRAEVRLHFARTIDEALRIALGAPAPLVARPLEDSVLTQH